MVSHKYLTNILTLLCMCAIVRSEDTVVTASVKPTQAFAELNAFDDYKIHRDLSYVEQGSKAQQLDLYIPATVGSDPLPLVVWIHGGGWTSGSKKHCPATPLLSRGYAVASIDYRLSQEALFPAQIHDCKAAVRWLRANAKKYNLDPNRIGVWGSSAGGHLAALLGMTGDSLAFEGLLDTQDVSSRVQAVCNWFGPSDFVSLASQSGPDSHMDHNAPNSPESRLLGGPLPTRMAAAKVASPITHVSHNVPPFLIMHGDKDPLVPHQQSIQLHNALDLSGVKSQLVLLKGVGHGGREFEDSETQQRVWNFFDSTLKPSTESK